MEKNLSVDVYLKSGQIINLRNLSKFTISQTNGKVTSVQWAINNKAKAKLLHIVPGEIVAIVEMV
jgi:hypothetical protein